MTQTRREFIATTSAATGAALLSASSLGAFASRAKKMRLLFLGGTGFLGPHMISQALASGHDVTIFNRGRTTPRIFADVFEGDRIKWLKGDRYDDISALNEGEWDSVIDTFTYTPGVVRRTVDLLAPRVKQYIVVSTMSVYGNRAEIDMDETAPLATVPDEAVEQIKSHREVGQHYGGMKALCEKTAEEGMPGRACSVRPGLIVGRGDPTHRFTYWPYRVRKGGEVLAPGEPGHYVQFIDAHDCAAFTLRAAEQNLTGAYNAVSPARHFTIGKLLDASKRVTGSDATFTWVDADFLQQQQVRFWAHLPAYVPPTLPGYEGFGQASVQKSLKAGLTIRPLDETIEDTLAWLDTTPAEFIARLDAGVQPGRGGSGMSAQFEKGVLDAWRNRDG